MLIREILQQRQPAFSFEFFPPKDDAAAELLFHTIADLMPLKPASVSITYGAGGSTRDRTRQLAVRLARETDLTVVAHLTCLGADRDEIAGILREYDRQRIYNILALRGEPPKGSPSALKSGMVFPRAADLVAFIKDNFPHFGIGVAGFPEGHPATPNRLREIDYLKAKVDAGADYIVTQMFFDNREFYDFRERCELAGIHVPIIAGLMPVTTRAGLARMAELSGGTRFPAALLRSVQRAADDDAVARLGTHWATEQVRDLLDHGARGVHFYTLNRARATRQIYETLGLDGGEGKSRKLKTES
ncbi:MAG: methylenetetrahydrofolate reductase [NAD(P)H] [Verrucomicrobiales bacterium]|jgi:methylenetetrahydrofolate reductase (NADPH)|nr:methylenetetrahydrofolate reductase [NAD(P)H] [Verrucomicrobiales bacterium]